MIQFSKSIEEKFTKEMKEVVRTIDNGVAFSVLSYSIETNYGKKVAEDFFNGLKKSGYKEYVGGISFEENMHNYFNKFMDYARMDWNQTPLKRSSFNYKPGDFKKIDSRRKKISRNV